MKLNDVDYSKLRVIDDRPSTFQRYLDYLLSMQVHRGIPTGATHKELNRLQQLEDLQKRHEKRRDAILRNKTQPVPEDFDIHDPFRKKSQ